MADYRRMADSLVDRLVSITSGLRATTGALIVAAATGALLGGAGLYILGAHPVLAFALTSLLAVPIVGLWRLRSGLTGLVGVAGRLRSLPGGLCATRDRLGDIVAEIPTRPTSPRAFGPTLRALNQAAQLLEASSPASVASAGLAVTPAALLAGLAAALWATAAFIVGAGTFLLALLTL